MSEQKPGEVVHILHEQLDTEGNKISEINARWYGFTNAEANVLSMMLVAAVEKVANELATMKSGKNKPAAR